MDMTCSEFTVHKKKIVLQGDDEIALKCGESKLVLKRDGTVIIKGVRVTNRARKTQKIKGASVHIN